MIVRNRGLRAAIAAACYHYRAGPAEPPNLPQEPKGYRITSEGYKWQ